MSKDIFHQAKLLKEPQYILQTNNDINYCIYFLLKDKEKAFLVGLLQVGVYCFLSD